MTILESAADAIARPAVGFTRPQALAMRLWAPFMIMGFIIVVSSFVIGIINGMVAADYFEFSRVEREAAVAGSDIVEKKVFIESVLWAAVSLPEDGIVHTFDPVNRIKLWDTCDSLKAIKPKIKFHEEEFDTGIGKLLGEESARPGVVTFPQNYLYGTNAIAAMPQPTGACP